MHDRWKKLERRAVHIGGQVASLQVLHVVSALFYTHSLAKSKGCRRPGLASTHHLQRVELWSPHRRWANQLPMRSTA
eukprot:scaffold6348_cov296-Prasinococcus_capsulatus_cf.AAC.1